MTCGYQPADGGAFDVHVAFVGFATANDGQCTMWNTGTVTRTVVYKVLCPSAPAASPGMVRRRWLPG